MIMQEKNKSYENTNSEFVEFVSIPRKLHPFKNPHRLPTEPMGIHHSPHTHTIPIPMGIPIPTAALLYGQCRAGAQINFPESWRSLGHVTPTIFGSTVGYPSDSLASCLRLLRFTFFKIQKRDFLCFLPCFIRTFSRTMVRVNAVE